MSMSRAKAVRADAIASVSRILDAARRVFATGDGSGTLDSIAREAGIGIATLYRHFPNRESLALALYDRMFDTELRPLLDEFGRSDVPRELLLDISERLLDVLGRERGLAASLGNIADATMRLLRGHDTDIATAVARAQRAGTLRSDIRADDIPVLLAAVAAGFGAVTWTGTARRRYLSLLLDGLNPDRSRPLPS